MGVFLCNKWINIQNMFKECLALKCGQYLLVLSSSSSSSLWLLFALQVEKESVLSTYTVNDLSMMKYYYECVLFVVRKPQSQSQVISPGKKFNKSNCWNKQLRISYHNDRTQPQISGAFLFLTKFRNSVYFLNMSIAFSEIYYAMHICTTQVKMEERSSSVLFPWSPELSFSRKNFISSVFMKLSVASLPC